MSKIEIFAGNGIENAFISNGITADETYRFDGNQWRDGFSVWALDETDLDKLNSFTEDDWPDGWGWYRYATGSVLGTPNAIYIINGHELYAWDYNRINSCESCDDSSCEASEDIFNECYGRREARDILEYFCDELGVSQMRNIAALSADLAKYNGVKISELFNKTLRKS